MALRWQEGLFAACRGRSVGEKAVHISGVNCHDSYSLLWL